MRCVYAARFWVNHHFRVAVVSGDQQLTIHFFDGFNHTTNTLVYGFTRFHCSFVNASVTDHVAVWIVTDDRIVFA
ncbi:Uncharacterised protein [Vibrio cholerae]|nr:Uncharacterised protein [Vibrio cholerae]CSC04173.1 Uncharacterised protein [Vibrio cholerae]CSC58288.1 Uncharacterised protein [Vibrio cholerae]CSC75409.1 Uncharacterised protein [Vibrio cholerae]CSD00509.1 Uncharacterised protein [Vibrio cholerae]